jgi:prophage regulatory protein
MAAMPEQSIKRTIRRSALRQIVPLADSTIYEMEQRGELPCRFALTTRCLVWDLGEVEAWLAERRRATESAATRRARHPDVRKRRSHPVKALGQAPASAAMVE